MAGPKGARRGPRRSDTGIFNYTLEGGWRVLAGRSDADNDYLSIKLARANDWWFHVRGMPGSHVVLRVPPDGPEPDKAALEGAAAVAAFHSKARSGGVVPVSATQGRYVSKPRGAKPGTVEIRKERVLKVRPLTEEAAAAARCGDHDSSF